VLHAHLTSLCLGLCAQGVGSRDQQWWRRWRERAGKQ
jgi:hypothetical protein